MSIQERLNLERENVQLKKELSVLKRKMELLESNRSLNSFSQHLIDKMQAIIFIKDVTNGFRYYRVNDAFCSIQHLSRQEVIGKTDYDLFSLEEAEKYRRDDEATVSMRGDFTLREMVHFQGEEKIILQTTKSYVETSEGNQLLVCVSYDITEHIQKERMMESLMKDEQEAHQMMKAIFHKLPSAILIKDIEDDYRFYIINQKFEQMCNMPKELLVGKTDYDIFPKEEADKYRQDDVAATSCEESDPMLIHEIVTSPDRGTHTHLQTIKFSFTFKRKKLLVCVGNYVTLQYQMMEQLRDALSKAEQADTLKAQFIANMSHEIRTPLNAIVGFSSLLTETEDMKDRKQYMAIVQENTELLLQLISDILDLSKMESGAFEFVKSDTDVNLLCGEIIRSLRMKVPAGVELVFEKCLPECHVWADKNRLNQVISNFINNALKFTFSGSITLGYYRQTDGYLRFYVRDTGMGIPRNKIKTVFDRFVKLNSFVHGTGLGLSICKSLVEQMGGTIGVESEEGEGSCFWFTYPYQDIVGSILPP